MPIVVVTALAADGPTVQNLLARLAVSVADALSCPANDVWCSFVPAMAQHAGAQVATAQAQCPVVTIHARPRHDGLPAAAMQAAAQEVGLGLGVPAQDVWVQWLDVLPGKVFAGGAIIG